MNVKVSACRALLYLVFAAISILLLSNWSPAQYSKGFNAGGAAITSSGVVYDADQAYAPPGVTAGFVGGRVHEGCKFLAVGGREPGGLYRPSRVGLSAYRFECPAGSYVVTLGFAEVPECYKKGGGEGPGLRIFKIVAEGKLVEKGLDIAAEGGNNYALKIRFHTEVKDGRLDVAFTPGLGEPILAGIHILQRTPDQTGPPPPVNFEVRPGFGRNILTWDPPLDNDYRGVHILRAPSGSSTFNTLHTTRVSPAFYLDHTAEAGKAYHYRLIPFDVYGNIGSSSAIASATPRGLEAPGIRNYHLTIDPEVLKVLNADSWSDAKVPATFTYMGKSFPVRVRYRGITSRNFAKKNWKVDFGHPGFETRREINLKAGFMDIFCIREKLAFDLFDAAGVMAPKARFVHLILNGEELGLYTEVEEVDESFLELNGRDKNGSLYEATGGTLHTAPNRQAYETLYTKKTNTAKGHDDLITFITVINNTKNADFAHAIADVLDIDSYLSQQAVMNWLCCWDSVHVNYYLAHHHDLDRWELFPWDQDQALGNNGYTISLRTDVPLDHGTLYSPRSGYSNQLLTRMLDVPLFRWKYVEKLEALTGGLCAPGALGYRINQAAFEVRSVGEADVLKWGWESNTYFHLGSSTLKLFSPLRIAYFKNAIPTYKPFSGPRILINELMADNKTTIKDEVGDNDDWIELFNPGLQAVKADGMYLTDDLGTPTKWKIPANTTIPAGGRLLVWADNEPGEGRLHATFKLSDDGEEVGLFDTDGKTLIDVIHYGAIDRDLSFGRTADGHAFFYVSALPTPLTANQVGGNLPPRLSCAGRIPNAPRPSEAVTITIRAEDDGGLKSVVLLYNAGSGYQLTAMFDDGRHGDGFAGDGVFGVAIPGHGARTRVHYYFQAMDSGNRMVTYPRNAPKNTLDYTVLNPAIQKPVWINEFLADNTQGIRDEKNEHEDWIELLNPGATAVAVGGLFLTDNLNNPVKWRIPANTSIPPGGTLLIWADGEVLEGPLHASFNLSASGEEIGLFDRDGITLLDAVTYSGQFTDVTTGRLPTSLEVWVTFPTPTPRGENSPAAAGGYLEYRGLVPIPPRPALAGSGTPRIGGNATFEITQAPPSTGGYLAVSTNPQNLKIPGVGTVLVNPLGLFFLPFPVNPQGSATVVVQLPQLSKLIGLRLYSQAVAFMGSSPLLSGGLIVRIGK